MHILPALVLAHCCICIFPEDSDDSTWYNSTSNIKFHDLIPRRHGKELFNKVKNFKNHRRKLLSYSGKSGFHNVIKGENFHLINSPLLSKERKKSLVEGSKVKENHSEMWDSWGNWSKCSVTCGTGRQVRWRHCSVEDCTKGLKKAQIKSCYLKNCTSKNILNWLGIKT